MTVGGELTLDMLGTWLDKPRSSFRGPPPIKGQQRGVYRGRLRPPAPLWPQELLNRWIVPLENRQDFLRLRTGQKFAVPFDQFIIFATNLEPRTLVDELFCGACVPRSRWIT